MIGSKDGDGEIVLPAFARVVSLDHLPRWAADLLIATLAMLLAVGARIAIEQIVGGVAPFLLTFPAVLATTLWAGHRAGIMAAVGCEVLTIQYVFPNWLQGHGSDPTAIANLTLATVSLAGVIWTASTYRRMAAQLRQQCQQQLNTLSLFVREMDHRTKNNFQIAAYLLTDRARGASEETGRELSQAAARLNSIASVYRNLLLVNDQPGSVELGRYLEDILALLRGGIVPDQVRLSIDSEPAMMTAHAAMIVGLLVNEWITNAVKYAFPDATGSILITVRPEGKGLLVSVEDDGTGGSSPAPGVGSRLMTGLAATIDGSISIQRAGGTRCVLRIDDASAVLPSPR